ncbi:MAG: LPS export ABC transporter periplasmic protein LptC [Thermodesulfobacteriota bacterium]
MKKSLRRVVSAFIALTLTALIVVVIVHYLSGSGVSVKFTEEGDIGIEIDNIHYSSTREGRVEWELDALSATRYKLEDLMVFDTLKVVFFAKDGTPYRLSSKEGRYIENRGELEAIGDVVITSPDGYNLKADSIKYVTEPGEITSRGPVKIASRGMDVQGVGLRVDVESGSLYLLKDVRAVLKDKPI